MLAIYELMLPVMYCATRCYLNPPLDLHRNDSVETTLVVAGKTFRSFADLPNCCAGGRFTNGRTILRRK